MDAFAELPAMPWTMRRALLFCLLVLGWSAASPAIAQDDVPPPSQGIVGIGAVLALEDGIPVVKQILPNGPAAGSGLQPQDKIIKVGDQVVTEMELAKVVDLIRGTAGSKVKLTVVRTGTRDPLVFSIVRAPVQIGP
jgi:carboxyl-terminal processing protease